MFETSFLSFSESALNADSISTKITDFAENFQISDFDGRPNFKAIPSQTSPFYSLHDDDYKNTILDPFTHSQDTIFTNSQKSEPVSSGLIPPLSEAPNKLSTTQSTTNNSDLPDSISISIPISDKTPQNSSIISDIPLSPISNPKKNFTYSNHLPNQILDDSVSSPNSSVDVQLTNKPTNDSFINNHSQILLSPTAEDDSEEPDLSEFFNTRIPGAEILLAADVHYNPVGIDNKPNPSWIVMSADPRLTSHTPLFYTGDSGLVEGVLVARGQLTLRDGQPFINKSAPIMVQSQTECESGEINPADMISPDLCPVAPFSFDFNPEDDTHKPVIDHVASLLHTLVLKYVYNYNYNFTSNVSNFWSNNTTNVLFYVSQPQPPALLHESSINTPVNLCSNVIQIVESSVDTPVHLSHNVISPVDSEVYTPVHLSHNIISSVDSTVDTPVYLTHNNITTIDSSVDTPVHLTKNNLIIEESTLDTSVDLFSNKLTLKETTVDTPVTLTNNNLTINHTSVDTPVNLTSNSLKLIENSIDTPVSLTSNELVVNSKSLETPVTLTNNNLTINHTSVDTPIYLTSNSLEINENSIDTPVSLTSNELVVNSKSLETPVTLTNNKINVNESIIDTPVYLTHNTIHVNNDIIDTPVTIHSNNILVDEQLIQSTAHVQNHKVNIVEQVIESNVTLPKFQVNLVEDEIPINLPIDNLASKLANRIIHHLVSNGDDPFIDKLIRSFGRYSSSTPSSLPSDDSVHQSHSNLSSEATQCNSYSESGNASSDNDDGENHRNDNISQSSASNNLTPIQWIIDKLKEITSKSQLDELIQEIQFKSFDLSPWDSSNPQDLPIILRMHKINTWLKADVFYCPNCESSFNSAAALHAHWKAKHGDRILPNEHAALEHLYNLKMRWKITDLDLPAGIPRFRNIWRCPAHHCNYIVNSMNAFACHIKSAHKEMESLRLKVGLMWASIICFAKEHNKLMSANDMFSATGGALCLRCKHFIGMDRHKVLQHMKSSHHSANVEGSSTRSRNISLEPIWFDSDLAEDDFLKQVESDFELDKRLRQAQLDELENERNIPVRGDNNIPNHDIARTNRINHENRLRERRENGQLINNEGLPEQRMPSDSSTSASPSEVEESNDSQSSHDSVLSEDDLFKFFDKAKSWIDKDKSMTSDIVLLPKIWGNRISKFRKAFHSAFKDKIVPLIDMFDKIMRNYRDNIDDSDSFLLWEGILAKTHLTLRKIIRNVLHIPSRVKEKRKHMPHSLEGPIQLKAATKFTAGVELIRRLSVDGVDDQPTLNLISDIKQRLLNFLSQAPDSFTQYLGGNGIDALEALLDAHNFEEKIEFLNKELEKLSIETKSNSSKYKKFIQNAYDDDPKRALDWFILSCDTPECSVPVENFVDDYGSAWKDVADFHPNDSFKLDQVLHSQDNDALEDFLLNDKAIQSAINSRSNLSAVGCDGICNAVWKMGGEITRDIVKHTIRMLLKCGKFPDNLKICKTVMIYKKGDPSATRSWRPITITSTLYRIIMCHISRSLQCLNDMNRFINSQQKGFLKIPAGAAEHIFTADEMIHHAARHRKNLYIVTIDFKDAFGSVPHKLIKSNLLDIGFRQSFVKAIMSSYKGSSTRIISNGRSSDAISFGKGVKQGCPLSPTLFNICIEPLLRSLNARASIDGYHWYDSATSVQAYADDIVLFSDSELGMSNLLSTVEEFCQYAGNMIVNSKKCSSLSFVINGNSRVNISSNFTIQDGTIENISMQSSTPYLGVPLAAKLSNRKRHLYEKIISMRRDVSKITTSPLKFTQTVDAIKRFILPRIDYELMLNAAPTVKLKQLDQFIRGKLSEKLGSTGLPKDWFYTAKKDGGLNLQSLTERHKALVIRQYIGLKESKDENIRRIIKSSINDELEFRDVDALLDSPFLNIPVNENGSIAGHKGCGTSNILSRTVKSLHDLHFGLSRKHKSFILKPLMESDNQEDINVKTSNIMKSIMKILQARHKSSLLNNYPLKGHSFGTLVDSPISSFFINPHSNISDSVTKFALKARLGSLLTGSLKAKIHPTDNDGSCPLCGGVETAHHILNGCQHKKHVFTKRHDEVVKILREFLHKKKLITHANMTVRNRDNERLTGDTSSLKPDLWWWVDNSLSIVEFTIPYGSMSDVNNQLVSTLDLRRQQKLTKYKPLVDACKSQFNCNVYLYVLIVSSLGAMPKETIKDLKMIVGSGWKSIAKQMISTSIRESMFIFSNWRPDKPTLPHPSAPDTDDDINNVPDSDSHTSPPSSDHSMNSLSDDEWNQLVNSVPDPIVSSSQEHPATDSSNTTDTETETDVLANDGTTPYWNVAGRSSSPAESPKDSASPSDDGSYSG